MLFGAKGRDTTAGHLAGLLRQRELTRGVLTSRTRVSRGVFKIIDAEIAGVANGLLDFDLGDLLLAGWKKYTALTAAAERSMHAPGTEEIVILATHQVTSTHRPRVDILVNGAKAATLVFHCTVTFDVLGLVAIVGDGALVGLRSGDCTVTAKLMLDEAALAEGTGRLDLGVAVPLQAPIPLVATVDRSSAGERRETVLQH